MDKCLVVDGFSRRRHTLFQAFAGLPRTGVLDARTIEMMNTPRWLSDLIFAQYFGKGQSLQYQMWRQGLHWAWVGGKKEEEICITRYFLSCGQSAKTN